MSLCRTLGLLEKGLGCDGKELLGRSGCVFIEDGLLATLHSIDEIAGMFAQHVGPSLVGFFTFEERDAVSIAVHCIELMGKLVESDIVAVENVDCAVAHGIPCEDDGAVVTRFTEAFNLALDNSSAGADGFVVRGECGGIEENGIEAGVGRTLVTQSEHACLRGDGEDHLVGQFEVRAALEKGISDKLSDLLVQRFTLF